VGALGGDGGGDDDDDEALVCGVVVAAWIKSAAPGPAIIMVVAILAAMTPSTNPIDELAVGSPVSFRCCCCWASRSADAANSASARYRP
jgi:hypothetical protein